MKATNPAYRRGFSTKADNSAWYYWRNHVKPELVAQFGDLETTEGGNPKLPPALLFRGQQLGRVMSRSKAMGARVAEIEKYVRKRARELASGYNKHLPLALVMSDSEFQRWQFCVEASRRADESADRLLRSLREEMEAMRRGDGPDLVGAMARIDSLPELPQAGEPEPSDESEG